MKHVQGNSTPGEIEFYKAHNMEFARVNVDIVETEGLFEWDCYEFPADGMTEAEIMEGYEELDAQYSYSIQRDGMNYADWKSDIDAAILDIMEAVM